MLIFDCLGFVLNSCYLLVICGWLVDWLLVSFCLRAIYGCLMLLLFDLFHLFMIVVTFACLVYNLLFYVCCFCGSCFRLCVGFV